MIKVNFTDGVEVMTSSTHLYQWDSNQEITISGLNIANASVHFTNKKRNDAIVVNGTRNNNSLVADIPNILLEDDLDIIAYVHVVASNKGNTIKVVKIPKIARQKPSDYQFTQNIEIMTFERLQSDFNDLSDECHEVLDQIQRELMTVDGEGAVSDGAYSVIKPRRATFSEWVNANTVLADGEIAVEVPANGVGTGISKFKIGDGVTAWNDLPYAVDDLQGAIDEVSRTIGYTVSKNLLAYPYYETTKEGKGITYTDIGDGTIRANGTATGNIGFNFFYRLGTRLTLKADTYIYYGCPKGGSESTYYMDIAKVVNDTNVTLGVDIGDGVTFTLDEDSELALSAIVMAGTTVNNLIFEPMIVPASLGKIPFEPYVDDVQTKVNRLYDAEKISINQTFTSSTTLTDVWTYTASKKCLLNASVSCGHYGGRPFQMALYKNGATEPFCSNNEGSETTSFKSIPLNIVLNKNEKVVMKARYNNASVNRYFVEGYVQYLE